MPAVSNERGIGRAPVAVTGLSSGTDDVGAEDSSLFASVTT
jgi:hypothetical protein